MDAMLKILSDYGLTTLILLIMFYIGLRIIYKKFTTGVASVVDLFGDDSKPVPTPTSTSTSLQNTSELIYNPFFAKAQYLIVVEIPSMEMLPDKPVKQQLFRDLLTINIKTIYDCCQEIAKQDMDDWSGEKWVVELSKKINSMVTDFHRRSIDAGIPDVVLFKFARWNSTTVERLYDYINVLGHSTAYVNHNSRTNTFFLIMNVLLVSTIGDAERSLKELNGEVAGKQYKNLTLED